MKDGFLLSDIGNSTLDFLFVRNGVKKREKLHLGEEEKLRSFLVANKPEETYISSVDKKGLAFLQKELEIEKIPYSLLTPEKMKEVSLREKLTVTNTDFLGSDLFCDILSRPNKNGLILLDLGTATKVLFLDTEGLFHGASILPGIALFAKSLDLSTDLLEDYGLEKRPPLVSLETKECISSGAINGQASLLSGMVKKIKEEYKAEEAEVLLTGGNAYLVKEILPNFGLKDFEADENLVLEGLARCFSYEDYLKLKKPL